MERQKCALSWQKLYIVEMCWKKRRNNQGRRPIANAYKSSPIGRKNCVIKSIQKRIHARAQRRSTQSVEQKLCRCGVARLCSTRRSCIFAKERRRKDDTMKSQIDFGDELILHTTILSEELIALFTLRSRAEITTTLNQYRNWVRSDNKMKWDKKCTGSMRF